MSESPRKERKPPKKKPRNLSPASQQRYQLEALLQKPDQEIIIPGVGNEKDLLPPDILLNIQGSSAGAGSGEFHVYKAARKREFERIKRFEDEITKEDDEKRFLKERDERQRLLDQKTMKNRKKREKKKGKKDGEGEQKKGGERFGLKVAPGKKLEDGDGNYDEEDGEMEAPEGLVVIEE
jgi:Protein of unknown function (DUF1168)